MSEVADKKFLIDRFAEIEKLIRSIKRCSLIAGRRKVWNHLADLYKSAKEELLIMGEGADLSDKQVRDDFKGLRMSTIEALRKDRNITRIQTFDTWIAWFAWLEELIEKFPVRFSLYFTTERMKFIPQLNIRDKEEVVAVPPEESVDIAYAVRIFGTDPEATRARRASYTHFSRLLRDSIRLRTHTQVRRLRSSIEAVKKFQIDLLVACEFREQQKAEQKIFGKPRYRTIQQYFTLDKSLYDKIPRKKLREKYLVFCGRKCKTLGEVLCCLCPKKYLGDHPGSFNYGDMAERIIERIPLGKDIIDPVITEHFLKNNHIVSSAMDISYCFSNALYFIARKISKT